MYSFAEIIKDKSNKHQASKIVVSGVLFVSKEIAVLCESEASTNQAILVSAEGLNDLLNRKIPGYGGGFISFVGEAVVNGHIQATGLNAMPYRLHSIRSIVFKSHHGIQVEYGGQYS